MKNFFVTLLLIALLGGFSTFVVLNSRYKNVILVFSPVKFSVEAGKTKTVGADEVICVEGVEVFSLEPSEDFVSKYSKKYNISKSDIISLGYLAQDYAQSILTNEKVTLKPSKNYESGCNFAKVKLNGVDYSELLLGNGFGIKDGEIGNIEKFKANLAKARKLNLVILNHHSNKYHTLVCPYGKIAHDTVILPQNQLPQSAKPCHYCHKTKFKNRKFSKFKKKFNYRENFNDSNIPQPPLVVTDGSIQVMYTDFTKKLRPTKDCSSQVCKAFVNLVDNSKNSIDIAIYGYDEVPALTEALTRAHSRGVQIRFVYDEKYDINQTYYKNNEIISKLAQKSVSDRTELKTQSNFLMHNKFVIFDKAKVWTGSMNFSSTGLSGYDVNDIVIVNSKVVADIYEKEFEQMLNGKFHTRKTKLSTNERIKLGDTEVEIYFSPQDNTSRRIVQIIKGAKQYIYVPAFLITHANIAEELINAKHRGVDVRVIIDANSIDTKNSKYKYLRQNGILLKTENYAGKLHSKTMIIDDEYLITGSMNFSNSGANKNDENTIIIKSSKIAKNNKAFFLYLWTKIPNKYLKYNAKAESKDSLGSCSDGIDNNFNGKIDSAEPLCR